MTEKDRDLVKKAQKLTWIDCGEAFLLLEKAESNEAKKIIGDICSRLYHQDEAKHGTL